MQATRKRRERMRVLPYELNSRQCFVRIRDNFFVTDLHCQGKRPPDPPLAIIRAAKLEACVRQSIQHNRRAFSTTDLRMETLGGFE